MSVDLDELDRLRAAATPAPWGMERQTNEHFVATNHSLRLGSERSPTWYVAAIEGRGYLADANAVLIVALVNAYPALAAELRALRKVRDEVQQRNLRYGCGCAMWLPFPERCPHVEEP